MFFIKSIQLFTEKYNQFNVITEQVKEAVAESGIKDGLVAITSNHTTTGIMVNEALECLESDIDDALQRLIPEDHPYAHARILRSYGSTAGNPTGHLKSLLTGYHCLFPLHDGELVMGEAQEIYFMEYDGPAKRTYNVTILSGS